MPAEDYTPSVEEIGGRLGARTLVPSTGKRVGTFNAETTPSATIVSELIEDAVQVVEAGIGGEIEEEYWKMAKTAVICYTCMSIELGFYPESTQSTDSAYHGLKERFTQLIEFISNALDQKRPNERRIVSLRQETTVGVRAGRLDPFANELFP